MTLTDSHNSTALVLFILRDAHSTCPAGSGLILNPYILPCTSPARRRDATFTAFRCAKLKCELVANSIVCLVPPAGRHLCGRCSVVSGVTRAAALTASHKQAAAQSDQAMRKTNGRGDTLLQTPDVTAWLKLNQWHQQTRSCHACYLLKEHIFAPRTPNSGSIRGFCAAVPCRRKHTASCASSVRDRLVADGAVRHDSVAVRRQTADAGLSRVQRQHSACVLKTVLACCQKLNGRLTEHCSTQIAAPGAYSDAWGFMRAMIGVGYVLGMCRLVLYAQPCGMSAPHGRTRPCPHTLRRTRSRGQLQGQVPVQTFAGT